SYAVSNPYAFPTNGGTTFAWGSNSVLGGSDVAMMADRGALAADYNATTLALKSDSSSSAARPMNSPNHDKDGQNVLYTDGHVDWSTTVWCGSQSDNIYTRGLANAAGDAQQSPAASDTAGGDNSVLPTDSVMRPLSR
ncbi:MAG TPA: hypothetical protein VK324_11775, partial [Tepidisphaeraceae bacterium]|nr:hypothetical protein [Tepidisphaeraceae bacterium]